MTYRASLLAIFMLSLVGCGVNLRNGSHGPLPVSVGVADTEYERSIEHGRAFVDDLVKMFDPPGISVAVSVGGDLVWAESRGYANLEERVPLVSSDPMRIHSLSKSLTSAALGLLHESGALDLDAPIQNYVTDFQPDQAGVTLRRLGAHLAGIRHYRGSAEALNSTRYSSVASSLHVFADDPLVHEPGSRYSYSSYGWNLLGAAVVAASGKPFPECMSRLVFEPFGMENTGLATIDPYTDDRVRYYERTSSGLRRAPPVDLSDRWPSGGMLSTTTDLVRFGNGLLGGRHLSARTVRLLMTPQETSSGATVAHGIGWSIAAGPGGRTIAFHKGGGSGGMSFLVIIPDDRFVFAAMANVNGEFDDVEPPVGSAMRALEAFLEDSRR